MKTLLLPSIVSLAALAAIPCAAEMFGQDYGPCAEQTTTTAIVACADARTRVWDQRLNAAYAALQKRIDPGQRDPLRAAQRLWIQYRDANCRFYGSQEGSIRQIQGAECFRAMTQDRALELEQAMKFD
ncbi:lysozyme inhibitor LprI family protein [Siccirubricoccus sp. G192]|uniref:lysozyme inhibitor LprI family protein n=1 Tax=Siccirubricoccus sp. G192 TaxID=2849651 RepID=UPI001C2C87D9|nr:lysozyme inhibitor LprI family protein [Siccirubricoccus sp. G192]MBV1796241.1 DUF1311 domain-containing protein [Siccirubricoccus sp. G192]